MLKRKIYNELTKWKDRKDKKALLIQGARQVGKTTTIRDFGNKHYRHFVEINFEKTPLAKQAFAGNKDTGTIILNLSAMGYGPFTKGETLIFFDEIQSCPDARTAIKFLVEDGSYDYIESGSLLGINYRDVSSYPVGFEHRIDMYPLDFEEFLWASGISDDVISQLHANYMSVTPVADFLHERIMDKFRQYMVVGGMPEAVATFTGNKDLSETLQIQKDIITSYRDDISKYAGSDRQLARLVFDAIPLQLSKEDKRFVLADIEKGASQRKYGDATQWLADAGVAYFSYNTKTFELPFAFGEKRNLYKLFMLDTGLLCSLCLPQMQFHVLNGDININEGALTENYVACELVRKGVALNYYDRKSKQELDFVFQENQGISVIEVKSGNDYMRHASLDAAMNSFHDRIERAMVLSKFNVMKKDGVAYYPLYMTMFF